MNTNLIYLDNAATTKPSIQSLEVFNKINAEEYYNPSASYSVAFDLSQEILKTKKDFLELMGDLNGNIIFTSGATESNNLAIFGSTFQKNKKYLFSVGEHPSVYNCAMQLKNTGYDVEFIPLQRNGEVDYAKLEQLLSSEVCFVSTMLVNNETGAINDIKLIRKMINKVNQNCVFHVDAVQAFGKIDFSLLDCGVNLCSISAHKIEGIKGVGALYISKGTKLKNINFGGGQENGLRSGTINAAAIFSFCASSKIAYKSKIENFKYIQSLKNYFIDSLLELDKSNLIIASSKTASPYIVSLMFEGNRGETIMRYLSSKGIFIGTGSACSTNRVGNRVLEAMGYTKKQIMGAIRISFASYSKKEEVDALVCQLKNYFKEINT